MRIATWTTVLWLGLGPALGAVDAAWAQGIPAGIFVTGQGVVSVAPDMASVDLGVTQRAPTAAGAMGQVSDKVAAILTQLDGLSIADLDRQTSGFYLRPVYENRPVEEGQTAQIVGYEAGNLVTVRVRDLSKIGVVLDSVILEGANNFNGLHFSLQDQSAPLALARQGAVADAMARAEQLAKAAGITLGAVLEMTENSQGYPPMQMQAAEMRSMDSMQKSIASGEIEVAAQVTMQFEIAAQP